MLKIVPVMPKIMPQICLLCSNYAYALFLETNLYVQKNTLMPDVMASEAQENNRSYVCEQLWTLEASNMSGEGFVIFWRPVLGENTHV